jgi:hypothetical protein
MKISEIIQLSRWYAEIGLPEINPYWIEVEMAFVIRQYPQNDDVVIRVFHPIEEATHKISGYAN